MELTKELFKKLILEEDFIITQECEECGKVYDNPKEEMEECEECGHDYLINTTSHEGNKCEICGGHIDMWQDTYTDGTVYVCIDCCKEFKSKKQTNDFLSKYYEMNPDAN